MSARTQRFLLPILTAPLLIGLWYLVCFLLAPDRRLFLPAPHQILHALVTSRAELFSALEMEEFSDRRCDKLSTGMKQKVSIARTLIHDPAVMIFDEPTHGLDVLAARAVVAFIRECRTTKDYRPATDLKLRSHLGIPFCAKVCSQEGPQP